MWTTLVPVMVWSMRLASVSNSTSKARQIRRHQFPQAGLAIACEPLRTRRLATGTDQPSGFTQIRRRNHGVPLHRESQLPGPVRTRFLHPSDPGDLIVGGSFRPELNRQAVRTNHREPGLRLTCQTKTDALPVRGDARQHPNRSLPIRAVHDQIHVLGRAASSVKVQQWPTVKFDSGTCLSK
jgi:hypothetical protein